MKKEEPTITFVEYRNPSNDEVSTVLFTRYDGSKTVIGYIDEDHDSEGVSYRAHDLRYRYPYLPADNIEVLKKSYLDDEDSIRTAINELDNVMRRGRDNERARQEQLKAGRSSKSRGKSQER